MKTKIFLFLFLTSFSMSDILYVKNKRCILDDYYFSNKKFHYTYSSTNNSASTTKFKSSDLEYGYEYIDSKCKKIKVLKNTKMNYQDYKFMAALTGLLIGFSIFWFSLLIFTRKR